MKDNNEKEFDEVISEDNLSPNDNAEDATAEVIDDVEGAEEVSEIEALKNLLQEQEAALEKEKKEYLFLMADFDNFKKRTMKEKAELIRNGGESALRGLLPIVDDFERGLAAMSNIAEGSDAQTVKEGMELIYNKFVKYLEQNGVKEIPTEGATFDADLHEAIAMVPTPDESLKGKVIDTIAKGYTLNDKVLRHAK
ncbi:MAG: nucleotide exchange factor GrpE, partial [Muribaculaceae bacterium]|nr:nucleotide exchange factor GrpE [Muribaculaceae bacterium]